MLKKLNLLILGFLFLVFTFSHSLVFAHEAEAMKVDHVATSFEKLKEKITLFLKFDKKNKVDYYEYLAEKRLAEIAYAVESNNIDLVEPTASRYSTYIGILTSFVDKNKVTDKKDDLVKMFEKHDRVLTDLQKKFKFESGWWLAIQHDINNTRIFSDKIKSL